MPSVAKFERVPKVFLERVRFLNGGYCRQLERLTGVRSWKSVRFQAVFIHFYHPIHGECLIDTGYGPKYHSEMRRWPWKLLNWVIPVPRNQTFERPDYLLRLALVPDKIRLVFLSHFHTDHIGGASQFPQSQFVYRRDCFEVLESLPAIGQLKHGFVPQLLPSDFAERSLPIEESVFQTKDLRFAPMRSLDFFGDGSLIMLDLPGHALGHTGYLLRHVDRTILYVVDAFWNRGVFQKGIELPRPSRYTVQDWPAYNTTLDALRVVSSRLSLEPIACHCPTTQDLVISNAN